MEITYLIKADENGIYLGSSSFATAPFKVNLAGMLFATGGTFKGPVEGFTVKTRNRNVGAAIVMSSRYGDINIFDANNKNILRMLYPSTVLLAHLKLQLVDGILQERLRVPCEVGLIILIIGF
ncbi:MULTISPECIES: hypothetical protein [unclassified Cohnella]|uniref:hypothetical protein n=1 Tax=unclassified Cohnella TaxID=2636738 RepID=UPI00118095E1|nr:MULTISPECIES: hypothetical protein [unclassified Cohnella]